MPANLSPEYIQAEQDHKHAQSHAEKVAALERMLATIPKHKGTEKMQADIKRRLSQARKESQKKGAAHATPFYVVPREGAGQVVLLGPPNSGKSQLVCTLTHARPEVADYPFTTRLPTPGMMLYENVQIQLVDLPPISPEFTETWIPQVVRNAHASVLVVDAADPELIEEIDYVERSLEGWRLPRPKLLIANKLDINGAAQDFQVLEELYGANYRCLGISTLTGLGLDRFARAVFDLLNLVRVYTKAPGKPADLTTPYVVRRGQTVLDVARMVHKDFAEHLKFARLLHRTLERGGMMVERDHVMEDEDIVELHT